MWFLKVKALPDRLFELKNKETELRGPPILLRILFVLEIIGATFAFVYLYIYFSAITVSEVVISTSVLDSSYTCLPLTPKNGVVNYKSSSSENGNSNSSPRPMTSASIN